MALKFLGRMQKTKQKFVMMKFVLWFCQVDFISGFVRLRGEALSEGQQWLYPARS